MEKKVPLVSIITVNYNDSAVTMDLLDSLRKISYPALEIIVVDNASPSDDPTTIKESYPEVKLILSEENLGFAGGNNLGIRASHGDFLFFINNDTIVDDGLIEPLVETLQKDMEIGMVSPKIKFHWDPSLIQYAGYSPMNKWTIRNNSIGYHQKDNGLFDIPGETESIHGAAMMVPRRVLEQVGMMTEIYFLYYEEHDWAEMIKRAGYKVYYQPKGFILHKESLATGKNSSLKTYYISRNRILFARRNFKGPHLMVSLLFQALVSIPKNTLTFLLNGQTNHLIAFWRAVLWNLTHFKIDKKTRILRKRLLTSTS